MSLYPTNYPALIDVLLTMNSELVASGLPADTVKLWRLELLRNGELI